MTMNWLLLVKVLLRMKSYANGAM